MIRSRSQERIRLSLRAGAASLRDQVTAASPGWALTSGDTLDLETTATVLLDALPEVQADHGALVERTFAWVRAQLDGAEPDVQQRPQLLAIASVLRHQPDDMVAQLQRARLIEQSGKITLPASVVDAFMTLLSVGGTTPEIDRVRARWHAQLGPGADLLQTARLLSAHMQHESPSNPDALNQLVSQVGAAFDPIHRCWTSDGKADAMTSALAIRAIADCWHHAIPEGFTNDRLIDAAEALCRLTLVGGGWGHVGTSLENDVVDNLLTATAVAALSVAWLRTRPAPLDLSRPGRVVDRLYARQVPARLDPIPPVQEVDHTMAAAIDRYCRQKLPTNAIKQLIADNGRIEIHGVYPAHLRSLVEARVMDGVTLLEELTENRAETPTTKRFNRIRPQFFAATDVHGRSVILCAVGVGEDYVLHYATMIRHVVRSASAMYAADLIQVYRYPDAEEDIAYWTGLDETLVRPGDRVVMGYVEECRALVHPARSLVSMDTEFYGSDVITDGDGNRVNFLGVKYSFWGSISYHLVNRICELGAREVIYCGKLGAMTADADLYDRLFAPTSFIKLRHDRVDDVIDPIPPNGIVERGLAEGTGCHVSIPTVLEENYQQREVASALGATSIDNEISQMAAAVSRANRERAATGEPVGFSAIHFATDYLRREDERHVATSHDLSNTRSRNAKLRRSAVLGRIANEVLRPYLGLSE